MKNIVQIFITTYIILKVSEKVKLISGHFRKYFRYFMDTKRGRFCLVFWCPKWSTFLERLDILKSSHLYLYNYSGVVFGSDSVKVNSSGCGSVWYLLHDGQENTRTKKKNLPRNIGESPFYYIGLF